MPAREFSRLVKESSFGTPKSPLSAGDSFYPRLSGANQIAVLMTPNTQIIPSGGGYNTPACMIGDTYGTAGNIQSNFYPIQTQLLLDWATTKINAGRTTPWVTTDPDYVMPVGDLASVSCYHAVQEGPNYKRRRPSGLKCGNLVIQSSRQSPIYTWNAAVVGIRDDTNAAGTIADPDATEFPAPAESDYPCDPWLFSHTSGGLKIGTSRTMFDSLSITFANTLNPYGSESKYPQVINAYGRTITIEVGLYRKPSPDDLASFRALTALDVEITLFDGTRTLTMDFGANNRWTAMSQDLPLDSAYRWTGTITNLIDPATGVDFSFTYDDGEE